MNWLAGWLVGWLIGWMAYEQACWFVGRLASLPIGCLSSGWLVGSIAMSFDWFIGWAVGWPVIAACVIVASCLFLYRSIHFGVLHQSWHFFPVKSFYADFSPFTSFLSTLSSVQFIYVGYFCCSYSFWLLCHLLLPVIAPVSFVCTNRHVSFCICFLFQWFKVEANSTSIFSRFLRFLCGSARQIAWKASGSNLEFQSVNDLMSCLGDFRSCFI